MTVTEIVPYLSLIATIIVGVILSKQIKSQSEMISHYKDYMNTFDLNKIKQLYDVEKTAIIARSEIETQRYIQRIDSDFHHQFDEMTTFTFKMLSQMTKEQRELAIQKYLTFSYVLFEEDLNKIDLHKNP